MNKTYKIPIINVKITKRLILDLSLHFFSTIGLAIIIWTTSKNIIWISLIILTGIFIDLDHLIDYFAHTKKWNLNSFLNCHFVKSKKLILPFHGWEYAIGALFLSIKYKFFFPIFLGICCHLIIDTLMHAKNNPLTYFISYRIIHRFSFEKINYYLLKRQLSDISKQNQPKKNHSSSEE